MALPEILTVWEELEVVAVLNPGKSTALTIYRLSCTF